MRTGHPAQTGTCKYRVENNTRSRGALDALSYTEFVKRFRMKPQTFAEVVAPLVATQLQRANARSMALSPSFQAALALRTPTPANFQMASGDLFNVSQPTVSSLFEEVIDALASIRHDYIKFLDGLQSTRFFAYGGLPGVSRQR